MVQDQDRADLHERSVVQFVYVLAEVMVIVGSAGMGAFLAEWVSGKAHPLLRVVVAFVVVAV